MLQLTLASLFFLGLHFGIAATPMRQKILDKIGPIPYRIAFASAALLGIIWLVYAWRQAPYIALWGQPAVFRYLAVILMPLAFFFIIAGITTKNPARLGQEDTLQSHIEPEGVLKITRHPMLWGIALWALLHLLANGDLAALVFFGTFLVLAVFGTYLIDKKRGQQYGDAWQEFSTKTSRIPFQAILEKRQHLSWHELGWWRIVLALALYGGFLHAHAKLFGVSPLG